MATIVFAAAGAAIGGAIGGSVLGVSAAVLGRAAGATVGRIIDSKILGAGSPAIDVGRIDRFRLTSASEGAPVARVHGRVRLAGQVIWASRFKERVRVSGGGKGAPSQPKTRNYSYSVSLAIALCEGEISRVGRIWADGNEIAKDDLFLRVYTGSDEQLPDPKIEAVEGAGQAPAYRGTAYVVIEDLQLAPFGNRVPQFTFEVMRPGEDDLADSVGAVAMIPGTGEYALATTRVHYRIRRGVHENANFHTPHGGTDFDVSLEALSEELPRCGATSLVVSWFGNDLRCGSCEIAPKVEQNDLDGVNMPWEVSGIDRWSAGLVAREDERPVYGGTPADASVVEAVQALKDAGQAVMFYPFILMEQLVGNGLPDPWSGSADQPVLPWRGRITTSIAPGHAGSPDGTAAAEAEVAAFFGTATAGEFTQSGDTVTYSGADGFSYRRFILHYAHLCALAGGVDAFCIGSEMRSLTHVRGANNSFPAVDALKDLAAEVRGILGPETKIGYAADWSEYFGYQPQDGSGDVFFHLDPLWSDGEIDFVGIDNYMPLSDWRDGWDHADAAFESIYNLSYLKGNIFGGEGYDWYYASPQAEAAQIRTPITDGAHGEPWIYRYKDLKNWWSKPHHERIGGVRQAVATGWQPESKPIWFTELGCAAIDKGTNQPNKFLDPKSSESSPPRYSSGARDDLIQMQYLRAMSEFWREAENNPVSGVYDGKMIDEDRMFVWAWDARPYPFFPADAETWSDGDNYARGHWLNGRVSARSLAGVIAEICAEAGVDDVDVSHVHGLVRGYAVTGGEYGRAALQPLQLGYGIDAIEKDGVLAFRNRDGWPGKVLSDADFARGEGDGLVSKARLPEAEVSGRVRLSFIEADGDYEVRSTEGIFPDEVTTSVSHSELPMTMTRGEARGVVERWLAEARVARDAISFALPPSSALGAGDVVEIDQDSYRIDRVEDAGLKLAEAVRIERGLYRSVVSEEGYAGPGPIGAPLPVWAEIMDLPLLKSGDAPGAPWLSVTSEPWPGGVAVYSSLDGTNWTYETEVSDRAIMGQTLNDLPAARPGLWDRGPALEVQLVYGELESIDEYTLFAGGNVAVIGAEEGGNWEVMQFRDAVLTSPETWALSHRLRGQRGSESEMASAWPPGSSIVVLDTAQMQLAVSDELRNLPRRYRIGPVSKPVDHASFIEIEHAATGLGLRPYAPAHLRAQPDGGGGTVLTWVRRSRVDGDTWALEEVPLGEAYESYRIRVLSGGVLRREATVASPTWTYDAAMRVADSISPPFDVEVAQISDLYGPGNFTRIVIND